MRLRPDDDVLELTVLGRGIGECVVVHMGHQSWLIVDTFVSATPPKNPVAIDYLATMDVDPAEVSAIVITHYDADHYRGVDRLFDMCRNARLCTTAATDSDLFRRLGDLDRGDSFARSIVGTIETAKRRFEDGSGHRVLGPTQQPFLMPHGRLMAIAPVDAAVTESMDNLRRLLEDPTGEPVEAVLKEYLKKRNLCSIALHGEVGSDSFLLCGDVLNDATFGWQAVVGAPDAGALQRSSYVKVAHHGSHTGHDEQMWDTLVVPGAAHLVVAPFAGGSPIPKADDIRRLCRLGASVHQAGISEVEARLTPASILLRKSGSVGRVSARKRIGSGDWTFDHYVPGWQHDCDAVSLQPPP